LGLGFFPVREQEFAQLWVLLDTSALLSVVPLSMQVWCLNRGTWSFFSSRDMVKDLAKATGSKA
jgi:hypothetical protein